MRTIDQLFARYSEFHRNATNKAIHWVCVPLIVWSVLGMLWAASPIAALLAIVASMVFFAWLSTRLALGMLVVVAVMAGALALIDSKALVTSLVVFVVAWIGQFVGHAVEGKRPSFFKDVQFLLIGPLWLLAAAYRRFGLSY